MPKEFPETADMGGMDSNTLFPGPVLTRRLRSAATALVQRLAGTPPKPDPPAETLRLAQQPLPSAPPNPNPDPAPPRNERFAALFESAPQAMLVLDGQGLVREFNQAAARIFGYPPETVLGRHFRALLPPCLGSEGEAIVRDLPHSQNPGATARELTGLRLDGGTFPMELSIHPVEFQELDFFVGVVTDLTERKRAESRLRSSEDFNITMLETAIDGVVVMDHEGIVREFNPAAERLFGWERRQLIGRSMAAHLIPPRLRERHQQAMNRYLEGKGGRLLNHPIEMEALRADGSTLAIELAITTITQHGRPLFVAYCRDNSEHKRHERELRQTKEHAEAANRAKSEFLAAMSHEIRTPLNAILGTLNLLLDTRLDDEQRNFAETAHESGKSLLTIINDILDFSKIEAGRLDLEETEFEVVRVVESVVELLAPRAHAKHIEISTRLEPDVPARLRADAGRLRQVLFNLAGNAVKFTRKGGVSVSVSLAADGPEQVLLQVEVADTGIGIPQAAQDRLFEKFSQTDPSHARRYGGSGLGLAISRSLVEMMGGQIGFTSLVSQGSTFWFTLSCARVVESSPPPRIQPALLAGLRVLIVEENSVSRRTHLRQLRSWGIQATAVANGTAALAALGDAREEEAEYATVLLDQWLPDMSGEELGLAILNNPKLNKVRLILLATMGTPSINARVNKLGFHAALIKPIRQVSLFRWLGAVNGLVEPEELESLDDVVSDLPPPPSKARRGRVLLVEDSHANQVVATAMLRKAGYQVDVAGDGMEAVQAVRNLPFDLVLMDLAMPEMDGFEATAEIRHFTGPERQVPIIAMTANAMPGDRERCLAAGMNDYLTKPIDRAQMLAVLDRWLGESEPEDAAEPESAPKAKADPASALVPETDEEQDRILDLNTLEQLAADTDDSLLGRVVGIFIGETRDRLRAIHTALNTGDWVRLQREAHTLKSGAGTFGAQQLHTHARRLDEACRAEDLATVAALAEDLDGIAASALEALSRRFC